MAFSSKKSTTYSSSKIHSSAVAVLSTGEDNRHVDNHHSERRDLESTRVHYSNAGLMEFRGLFSRLLLFFPLLRRNHSKIRKSVSKSSAIQIPKQKPPKLISFAVESSIWRRQNVFICSFIYAVMNA